jgi:hypothetical protein
MGPRQEDNSVLLLTAVALICGVIAVLLPGLFEPTASVATSRPPTRVASQEPVRVIGAPFIPNTNPRER